MRHLLLSMVAIAAITACNSDTGSGNRTTSATNAAKPEPASYVWTVTTPDSTITPETSWSDLFLDSAVVENFIQNENVSDTAATALRHFYNRRNYGFAWLNTQGLTEPGKGLWNRNLKSAPRAHAIAAASSLLDSLLMKDTVAISAADTVVRGTELKLTLKFIELWNTELRYHSAFGLNDPMVYVPAKKVDPIAMAEILAARGVDSAATMQDSADLYAPHTQYRLLLRHVKRYLAHARSGGLLPLTAGSSGGKKGSASNGNSRDLRQHLYLHGFLEERDTASLSPDSLRLAIKHAQRAFHLDTTGEFNDSLKTAFNQPLPNRIAQLLVNMNRLLWVEPVAAQTSIRVNIPEFQLRVFEGRDTVFSMPVIVGSEGAATLQFGGMMDQVVFNPYWNIPQSIATNEILPASKKDPGYLKKKRIERRGGSDDAPMYRQLPGPDNSLGLVKFLFPNNYDIYLHDTPAKDAFRQGSRALSHGCIRLSNATKLAQYLLRDDASWSPETVRQAMDGKEEKKVNLKDPVPVRITYLTATVGQEGQLQFFNDIYRLDEKQYHAMFRKNTTATPAAQPVPPPASPAPTRTS